METLEAIYSTRKLHYWNSLDTDPGWLNFGIEMFFDIIMRYSLKVPRLI
ncbi:hypothetical protein T03_8460 [Trichinella britovi]|uniref:Uncharacterized protein n=1 Tax=Trichinella britovi TaxID=45882 RepID=A0A0V1CYI3_TRIBR|nr:hypothetical protein T03_8460 [Trichinella britovi]